MPSNLLAIDSNFPTFTGEEPVEEQIRELVNYLYQLRESLQYSLQNLSTDNFNAAALDSLSEEAKGEIGKQLQQMANELNRIFGEVETLKGRISGIDALSGKMETAEKDIASLKDRVSDAETDVAALQEWSIYQEKTVGDLKNKADSAEQELADLKKGADNQEQKIAALTELVESMDADVAEIVSKVQVAEDGSATVGEEGKDLHLIGNVYINGILFEQGGSV